MSQEQLAEKLHVTRQAVSNWETEKRSSVIVNENTAKSVKKGVSFGAVLAMVDFLCKMAFHRLGNCSRPFKLVLCDLLHSEIRLELNRLSKDTHKRRMRTLFLLLHKILHRERIFLKRLNCINLSCCSAVSHIHYKL